MSQAAQIPKITIIKKPIGPSFALCKIGKIPDAITMKVIIKHPLFLFFVIIHTAND